MLLLNDGQVAFGDCTDVIFSGAALARRIPMAAVIAEECACFLATTAHIGLACQLSYLFAKPGAGGDAGLMIQTNEMRRTLALLQAGGPTP